MPQLTLPIDVVPGYEPRKFYWHQLVDTVVGKKSLTCTGALPSGVDDAVAELIKVAKRLAIENAELKRVISEFADRIAKQSELLSRRAEKRDDIAIPVAEVDSGGVSVVVPVAEAVVVDDPPPQQASGKRGRNKR